MNEAGGQQPSGLNFIPSLRPIHAMLLLGLAAQTLFLFRLGQPDQMMFDETHYVPAARALFGGNAYLNVEHPLLGKWLIGLSMALFGDTPWGWRLLSTFAGTATVTAIFLIAQSLFREVRLSLAAGAITLLDQLVFIQARIAMLDIYMSAFLLLGLWMMIEGYASRRARAWLIGAGLMFGLAVGAKWTSAPYLAVSGLAFIVLRLRHGAATWPGVSLIEGCFWLGACATIAYLATFIPAFFVTLGRIAPGDLIRHQLVLYTEQTKPLAQHTYQSQWWQWAWIGRPIWYLYEPVQGVQRGVLLVGNPAVMWGGLVAVAACLVMGIRQHVPKLLLVAGLFLFSYLIWAVIPKKIGFYYYYYLPAIFLSLPLAATFHFLCRGRISRRIPPAFFALALVLFLYFYPIIAAVPLSSGGDFVYWTWFESWK